MSIPTEKQLAYVKKLTERVAGQLAGEYNYLPEDIGTDYETRRRARQIVYYLFIKRLEPKTAESASAIIDALSAPTVNTMTIERLMESRQKTVDAAVAEAIHVFGAAIVAPAMWREVYLALQEASENA